MLGLRKLRDVVAGILKGDQLAAAGQRDWILKGTLPALWRVHQPAPSIGSRNRFMVNSIFADCKLRQLLDRYPIGGSPELR
jgi:hypothetical protein